SRSCRGVVCPGAADAPTRTTCRGGACVDPTCTVGDPACPIGCASSAECPMPASCATTSCVDGVCLAIAGATTCAATERCDPDVGCVPRTVACTAPLTACGGVCSDTRTDAAHCGDCATSCPAPMGATATCASATCGFTCSAGLHHCGTGCSALPCGG